MYDGERVEREVMTVLQAGLSTALDAVEALWTATDPITLPEPENWARGYRAWMLDLPSTSYPYILVIVPQRTPDARGAGRQFEQSVDFSLLITMFLCADTEVEVVTLAHRYAEAMVSVLQDNQEMAGYVQVNYEPLVRILTDNQVHYKLGNLGDREDPGDMDYLRVVEIEQTLGGLP